MSENVFPFPGAKIFQQLEDRVDSASQSRLKNGDGDGTSSDMEARVARLEKNVDAMLKDVADIRVDIGTLKENVRHLPTKPWMFSTLAAMLTALAIVMGMIVRFIPHA